jgi:hypothetical protein
MIDPDTTFFAFFFNFFCGFVRKVIFYPLCIFFVWVGFTPWLIYEVTKLLIDAGATADLQTVYTTTKVFSWFLAFICWNIARYKGD